ncbi:MAG: rod shape-determining protein MreC [Chloroflexi bacterium]|nr:MAG: rod shape-determining protein MreC [Chloroflexota bacterium]
MRTESRRLILGLVLALLLLGFALDRAGYAPVLRGYGRAVFTPVLQTLTSVVQQVSGRVEAIESVEALRARNAELEATVNRLMVENVRLREVERENEQLRQLLNYTRNNPLFTYQPTTVIGRSIGADPTNLLYFVYVDVGARDGIATEMPVVTERGLVGRVTAVGPNSAQVLLIIDPSSAVNAIIQNSRATGVVRGSIDGVLVMDRIPPNAEVSPGDIVLTSGLGGNFPDKIVIGQVTEVTRRDQDMFQTARIRPTVDFGKLERMLIITSFQPIDFDAELKSGEDSN